MRPRRVGACISILLSWSFKDSLVKPGFGSTQRIESTMDAQKYLIFRCLKQLVPAQNAQCNGHNNFFAQLHIIRLFRRSTTWSWLVICL